MRMLDRGMQIHHRQRLPKGFGRLRPSLNGALPPAQSSPATSTLHTNTGTRTGGRTPRAIRLRNGRRNMISSQP